MSRNYGPTSNSTATSGTFNILQPSWSTSKVAHYIPAPLCCMASSSPSYSAFHAASSWPSPTSRSCSSPSSRITEAYTRPPTLNPADIRSAKHRSMDSAMLFGSPGDISAEDPMFILRCTVACCHSTSRNRSSTPLDEIALQKFHRESVSSSASDATIAVLVAITLSNGGGRLPELGRFRSRSETSSPLIAVLPRRSTFLSTRPP